MSWALNKMWPLNAILPDRNNSHGYKIPVLEKSIFPDSVLVYPKVLEAILFMAAGFMIIFLMEYIANKKSPN